MKIVQHSKGSETPQDIDNTHVISLIERKMTKDYVKIWALHIHSQRLEPSMKNLLKWMDEEMTARLRSGATIRKTQGHPTAIFGKYLFGRRFETNNFRNICCKIYCLPASPRVFEHLKKGIITHFKRTFTLKKAT